MGMEKKLNAHGEITNLTLPLALNQAKHNVRYKHGEWFVWMHKSGEWYCSNRRNVSVVEDAELNFKRGTKVYFIGEGYSDHFTTCNANIIIMWSRNVRIGC